MSYSLKSTHVQEAIDNLIDAFSDKPLFTGLLSSYVQQIQDLEDAFSEILTETTTTTSTGAQLDALGSIVGELREGRNDLQYSTAINAQILLLQAEGTPEDIIALTVAIAGSVTVVIEENFPASFAVTIDDPVDPTVVDVLNMGALIASGKPAGVGMSLIWYESLNPFRFDTVGQCLDQGELATQEDY